jgi:hypothetical protein
VKKATRIKTSDVIATANLTQAPGSVPLKLWLMSSSRFLISNVPQQAHAMSL